MKTQLKTNFNEYEFNINNTEELLKNWGKVTKAIEGKPTLRNLTLESWARCTGFGIQPEKINHQFLSEFELKQKQAQNSNLIDAARPYMENISLSLIGVPHIIALADKGGWIIEICGTVDEFGGSSVGFDLGSSWAERTIGNNGIGTALAQKEPVFVYGVEHYGISYKLAACLGVPIHDNTGEIVGALDISVPTKYAHPARMTIALAAVSSIEESLSAQQQAQQINQAEKLLAIGSLLSTSVHDLKNSLAVVRGLGQLGSLTAKDGKENQYFKKIVSNIDEITNVINDLINTFRDAEEFTVGDLAKFLKNLVEEQQPFAQAQKVNIQVQIDEAIQIALQEPSFKKALINLITNSIQAMPQGGNILINAYQNNNKVIIEVSDTGGGIPQDIQEDLFNPFVTAKENGTGLGLFMVHYVVTKIHQGKIWFETIAGQGTTFFIELASNFNTEKYNFI